MCVRARVHASAVCVCCFSQATPRLLLVSGSGSQRPRRPSLDKRRPSRRRTKRSLVARRYVQRSLLRAEKLDLGAEVISVLRVSDETRARCPPAQVLAGTDDSELYGTGQSGNHLNRGDATTGRSSFARSVTRTHPQQKSGTKL